MMTPRKRWLLLLLAAIVITLVVLVIQAVKSELIVEGRPLSHWLAVASNNEDGNDAARTNAETLIRSLGPAIIPYLLDWLQTPPGWREKYGSRWNQFVIGRGSSKYTVDRYHAHRIRSQAVIGFQILGTNGVTAIPKLRKLMRDDRYAKDVARVLGRIQSDEALDMLLVLLKHPDSEVRFSALDGLGEFRRERLLRATNDLVQMLDDSDEGVAAVATHIVSVFVPASQAVPALTRKLSDSRTMVAQSALRGFHAAGPHAEPARSAILTMLTNSDEQTRSIATNVVFLLNPARAPEFGIITNGIPEHAYEWHQRVRQEFATNNVPYLHQ
jgi:hypothetical protein